MAPPDQRTEYGSTSTLIVSINGQNFLRQFQEQIDIFDPDIIVTRGGDQRLFSPRLNTMLPLHAVHLRLGRNR